MKIALARRRTGVVARYHGYRKRPSKIDVPSPSKPLSRLLAAYGDRGSAPEILHLGGSESEQVSYDDWSKRTLRRLIRDRVAPLRVCHITNTAYNPEVYASVLRALEVMPRRPQLVLANLTIRMTSPLWFHNPTWRFTGDVAAMDAYASDPEAGVGLTYPYPEWINPMREARSEEEWERYLATPVSFEGRPEQTVGECLASVRAADRRERERLGYVFNYLHLTQSGHPRLAATTELFALLDRLELAYVCFLHPQNHEKGRRLLGSAWDRSTARNRDAVLEAAGPRARVHDWLELLPESAYYDSVEHWNETGRPVVADEVRDAIAAVLPAAGASRRAGLRMGRRVPRQVDA